MYRFFGFIAGFLLEFWDVCHSYRHFTKTSVVANIIILMAYKIGVDKIHSRAYNVPLTGIALMTYFCFLLP